MTRVRQSEPAEPLFAHLLQWVPTKFAKLQCYIALYFVSVYKCIYLRVCVCCIMLYHSMLCYSAVYYIILHHKVLDTTLYNIVLNFMLWCISILS